MMEHVISILFGALIYSVGKFANQKIKGYAFLIGAVTGWFMFIAFHLVDIASTTW